MGKIKFRTWNKQSGSMIPDDFLAIDLDGEISEVDMLGDCTWKGTARCEDKYILMQYTGLQDKNDTNIYEDDILLHHDFGRYVVKFKKGCFMAIPESVIKNPNITYKHSNYLLTNFSKNIEIVGNIYENSKLLEEEVR